jgi:hypothetical protein
VPGLCLSCWKMHLLCLKNPYACVFHEEPTMSLKRVMEADAGDAASR